MVGHSPDIRVKTDIPEVERRPSHVDATLCIDQASCARRANVWASGAQVERDFWFRRRG